MSISSLARYRQALCDFVARAARAALRARRRAGRAARRRGRAWREPAGSPEQAAAAARARAALARRCSPASLICADDRGRGVGRPCCCRSTTSSTSSRREGRAPIDDPRDRPRRGGQAADDHDPRLRPALRRQEARAEAALGHDHARPPGPGQGRDRGDVDPARPARSTSPGSAAGQDQRAPTRTAASAADAADGQAAALDARAAVQDQPRHHRRLQRLPPGGRLHRLRLRRHRPPLLQRPRRAAAATRRSTSTPATRSSAARTRSTTSATATRTTTSCAPRASRTSCARCATSRASRKLMSFEPAQPAQAGADLRPLLRLRQGPARRRSRSSRSPSSCSSPRRTRSARCRSGSSDAGDDVNLVASPDQLEADGRRVPRGRRRPTEPRAELGAAQREPQGSASARAQPSRIAGPGRGARRGREPGDRRPRARSTSRSTSRRCCTSARRLRRRRRRASTRSATSCGKRTAPTAWSSPASTFGEYYGVQGMTLARPADPRRPARDASRATGASCWSTATAAASGSSPGGPSAASTGSPTRSRSRSRADQMSASPRRCARFGR